MVLNDDIVDDFSDEELHLASPPTTQGAFAPVTSGLGAVAGAGPSTTVTVPVVAVP